MASVKTMEYKENNSNLLLISIKRNNIPNFFIKFWEPVLRRAILDPRAKEKKLVKLILSLYKILIFYYRFWIILN